MKNSKKISVLVLVLLLSACSQESPPPHKVDTGRPETRTLEAASAVGYDGKAIRKKVDGALDANDTHNAELEKQMQEN
jgi:outer membrane murein-binding lipoprotein Lpp